MSVNTEFFSIKPDPFLTAFSNADKNQTENSTSSPQASSRSQKQREVPVYMSLFVDVTNAADLIPLLQEGKIRACLLRAELILEAFQVLAAINRAVSSQIYDKMATKSVHSEIVYSLSPTKNISESLKTFGIDSTSKNLLVVTAGNDAASQMKKVAKRINGKNVSLAKLRDIAEYQRIKEVYHVGEPEINKASILDAIVTRIIAKDYV